MTPNDTIADEIRSNPMEGMNGETAAAYTVRRMKNCLNNQNFTPRDGKNFKKLQKRTPGSKDAEWFVASVIAAVVLVAIVCGLGAKFGWWF